MKSEFRECHICTGYKELNSSNYKKKGGRGKGAFTGTCRECLNKIEYDKNWRDGLLKCMRCTNYFEKEEFSKIGGEGKKCGSVIRENRRYECRKCQHEHQKEYYRNLSGERRLKTALLFRLKGALSRSLKNGIEYNITIQHLLKIWGDQKGKCALSGIPMTFEIYKGRINSNVSLDRITPHLGYTKGNVQLVCMAANQMKNDLTNEELFVFCEKILIHNLKIK